MIDRITTAAAIICLTLFFGVASNSPAQSADPEKRIPPPKSTPKTSKTPPKTTRKKQPRQATVPSTKKSKTAAKLSTITIAVDEPDAQIFLTGKDGASVFETEFETSVADTSLEVEGVAAGDYNLLIRKDGFEEFKRQIKVSAGKPAAVSVNLKPAVGFLTVKANIPNATIEIANVGTFNGEVIRQKVKLGTRDVRVIAKGFVSSAKVVEVELGREQTITFEMEPVSIVELLSDAGAFIRANNFAGAIGYCEDILALEPDNPKANLLMGRAHHFSQKTGAAAFFLKAIRQGEMVAFDIRLLHRDGKNVQLIASEMVIDRSYLSIRTSGNQKLNMSVLKADAAKMQSGRDALSFIAYKGRALAGGKNVDRNLKVYSAKSALTADRSAIICPGAAAGFCDADINGLYEIITAWQSQ